jgi:hypothetical protein
MRSDLTFIVRLDNLKNMMFSLSMNIQTPLDHLRDNVSKDNVMTFAYDFHMPRDKHPSFEQVLSKFITLSYPLIWCESLCYTTADVTQLNEDLNTFFLYAGCQYGALSEEITMAIRNNAALLLIVERSFMGVGKIESLVRDILRNIISNSSYSDFQVPDVILKQAPKHTLPTSTDLMYLFVKEYLEQYSTSWRHTSIDVSFIHLHDFYACQIPLLPGFDIEDNSIDVGACYFRVMHSPCGTYHMPVRLSFNLIPIPSAYSSTIHVTAPKKEVYKLS